MQSEMAIRRAAIVQISFHQSYNLYFEIIRRTGNDIRQQGGDVYFCGDADACTVNAAFTRCLDGFDKMFMGAYNKSYGVREELRGSGQAIEIALQEAPNKVDRHLSMI
jgi:hypothetical protein